MQRSGRTNARNPHLRVDSHRPAATQAHGDPVECLVLAQHHDPSQPSRSRRGQNTKLTEVRLRSVRPGQMALQITSAQPGIDDQIVEARHHRRLRQDRQLGQRPVCGMRAEDVAVVRRVGRRVRQQTVQLVLLMGA